MNTGYIPSDPTDYVSFIFPLLCIGGLITVYSLYKKEVRNSILILTAAVILSASFHFFEIYFYDSGLPFGFIFLFTGTLSMIIGSGYLFFQLRNIRGRIDLICWTAIALFLDNFLLVALALFTEVLPPAITNPIMAILMVSVGLIWSAFGLAVIKLDKEDVRKIRKPTSFPV